MNDLEKTEPGDSPAVEMTEQEVVKAQHYKSLGLTRAKVSASSDPLKMIQEAAETAFKKAEVARDKPA